MQQSHRTSERSRRGFSLSEMLVVLAIVSILLSIGVPGIGGLIQNQRMLTTVNDFFAAINLARAEAIHRGMRVDLVPADGTDWVKGWVVFVDENSNHRVDAEERIIFSHGPVAGGMHIKSALTDSSKPYLAYNGSGRTRTNASNNTPQLGTISFFLGEKTRRIKLNFLGRARMCDPDNDSTCTGSANSS